MKRTETQTIAQRKERAAKLSADELNLRRMLWLRHGCKLSALYGDDGCMQCSKCMIDFRNDSVDEIENRFAFLTRRALGVPE